mgnify:CR=1 FL=1
MSSAVTFLLVALAAAVVISVVVWALQHRPRRRPPDFQDQLRALAPREGRTDQAPGIVPLDRSDDEER